MWKHKILISKDQLEKRVAEIAATLSQDYRGQTLDIICILKGSFIFVSDLIRKIDIPVRVHFLQVSSYGTGSESSGTVNIHFSSAIDLQDKDVLLVEDVLDTGITLDYLMKHLREKNPRSLKVCILLHKPDRMKVEVIPDYTGFKIPDEFVIGYGLDFQEVGRNLNYVAVLDPAEYRR